MKVLDEAGVARLVENVGNAVRDGKWLPVREGGTDMSPLPKIEVFNAHATGAYSIAMGLNSTTMGDNSYTEGFNTTTLGSNSHAEGDSTKASGSCSHAEGSYNWANENFIHSRGIGTGPKDKRNAVVTYAGGNNAHIDSTDPKHGYTYLLGIGGYEGQEIGDAKSLQEVIAELETPLSDEEIDSIIGDV